MKHRVKSIFDLVFLHRTSKYRSTLNHTGYQGPFFPKFTVIIPQSLILRIRPRGSIDIWVEIVDESFSNLPSSPRGKESAHTIPFSFELLIKRSD